jgi:hypothetical protein
MNQEEIDAYWAEVKTLEPPQIEYRLHYNDLGEIVMCSMSEHPAYTQYVVVTRAEYDRYFDYCVADGKLTKINRTRTNAVKLKKSTQGLCVIRNHAGVLLENTETYQDTEYYEYRSN